MEKFQKPERVFVSDQEYIEKLVKANLQKDLCEGEELCQHCHGTGMVIRDNVYGLSGDPENHGGVQFPYKHQSITNCPYCFNGIVYRCKYCGELIPHGSSYHVNCQKRIEKMQEETARKEVEALMNAPLATKEVLDASYFLYSDHYSRDEGYFTDWDDFFQEWHDNEDTNPDRPEYVWATEPINIELDAHNILENATDDLYDGAMDDIGDVNIKKLQMLLDKWCKECGPSPTYVQSKYKVRIPWEEYDKYYG